MIRNLWNFTKVLALCLLALGVLSEPPGDGGPRWSPAPTPRPGGLPSWVGPGPLGGPLSVSEPADPEAPLRGRTARQPKAGRTDARTAGVPAPLGTQPEVRFMRSFIARVNPALVVEDARCAADLPTAILRASRTHGLDWRRLFTLAWQESSFDCHAKNRRDPGGAYGPFQIRPLWASVTGDPRRQYFDPELAVERVVEVARYYRTTRRYEELVQRRFRNPLLCLYNTGENLRVNMRYCREVGDKLELVRTAWARYLAESDDAAQAPARTAYAPREGAAGQGGGAG